MPGRTGRTPDAPECNLSLLSAGPSQRGMLWFLTPLLWQEASEAVASRALQQAQSKAAPMGTLRHRQPAPCALGTAEPLHTLHCAPTSTPGTCAASTLCHTQHCGHPAARTHPGHRHCPSTLRGNTYLGSAAMSGSGDRTMGWDMTAPSMSSSYPSPCAPRLGANSPPQYKQLTDVPHCSPEVATPLLAPHELLPVLGMQQGPGLQCHPSAEGTFLPQAGASVCPSSPSPALAGLPFDRHITLFRFLWLPISVLCLLGQPKTEQERLRAPLGRALGQGVWGSCLPGLLLEQKIRRWKRGEKHLREVTLFAEFLLPTLPIASLQHPQSTQQRKAAAPGELLPVGAVSGCAPILRGTQEQAGTQGKSRGPLCTGTPSRVCIPALCRVPAVTPLLPAPREQGQPQRANPLFTGR